MTDRAAPGLVGWLAFNPVLDIDCCDAAARDPRRIASSL
jgi:hypothetical protein